MRTVKCPFCEIRFVQAGSLEKHIQGLHKEQVPENFPIRQILFNINNRYEPLKQFGTSVIFKKPTTWNPESGKYDRFSSDAEIVEYKKQFKERMMRVHGKTNLLNDPEMQRKMLSNRKISSVFTMHDGGKKEYTGSYEKDFLYFLNIMHWPSNDIVTPAPVDVYYTGIDGKKHFYIPDFYIPSLNLIVEIKSSENGHYRARDIETEKLKDAAIEKTNYTYVKVFDKKYDEFVNYVQAAREDFELLME